MTVTAEYLRDILDYSPETGLFTWRVAPNGRIKIGQRAGSPDTGGHLQIRINKRFYRAHRLAWLYVHGEWPPEDIDHINSERADNRLCNLRPATRAQNCQNSRLYRSNTSGFKGVVWHARGSKWSARIRANGRVHHLGRYTTAEAAHAAYVAAAVKYHGEFARPA